MIERGLGVRVPRGPLAFIVLALLLVSIETKAQQIRVDSAPCGQPVHLVARDAPLSDVLAQLGNALHFRVVYQTQTDPRLTADERLDANTLVRRLVRNMNYSLQQRFDARCTHGLRIEGLAVLPEQGDQIGIAAQRPVWQTAETERIAREGLADYLRSHGMDDQPIEALAVH